MTDPTTSPLMKVFLGEYEVVERGLKGTLAIALGNNVHIQMHMASFPYSCKPGDRLPLFTYVPYNPESITNALLGKPSE